MKRVLVVGLAVVLAAGNAFAGGGSNSSSTTTGSTSSGNTSSDSGSGGSGNSGNSAGQQGGARGGTASHSSGNRAPAPVARAYPANVAVPNTVPVNAANARLRMLDRSELLARQAAYFNRNRVNPVQNAGQSTADAGQIAAGQVVPPREGVRRGRHNRDGRDNPPNGSDAINGSNGTQTATGAAAKNGRPMPATNTPPRSKRPVLNFNNSDTMSFKDACGRHRDHHDRDWWRNHCTTIILIGGGFYAWDLGYWYPAYGYDNYYSNYAYDGPIYGYDGLPPDQIIANVQYALQQLGYFSEAVDGVLGGVTRSAIEDYQVENDLPVTGAIDRPLLVSLGFIY